MPRGKRNGKDCTERHEERRGSRQEAGEGLRQEAGEGRAKSHEERRGSRQEARGTRTGTLRYEEREREGTVPQRTRMAKNAGTNGNVEERRRVNGNGATTNVEDHHHK